MLSKNVLRGKQELRRFVVFLCLGVVLVAMLAPAASAFIATVFFVFLVAPALIGAIRTVEAPRVRTPGFLSSALLRAPPALLA